MVKHKFNPKKPNRVINLAIQDLNIRGKFPDFICNFNSGEAIWHGLLQPRFTSPKYMIEIRYKLKQTPKVWVLSPPLVPDAVHLYKEKNLCLYWPKEWSWQPNQLIAKTIIPWTASWLFFYELWLDTGEWFGPSSHDYFPTR